MPTKQKQKKNGINLTNKIICTTFLGYVFVSSAALMIKKAIRDKWQTGKWFPNG